MSCSTAAPQSSTDSNVFYLTSGCSLAPMVRRIYWLELRDSENNVYVLSSISGLRADTVTTESWYIAFGDHGIVVWLSKKTTLSKLGIRKAHKCKKEKERTKAYAIAKPIKPNDVIMTSSGDSHDVQDKAHLSPYGDDYDIISRTLEMTGKSFISQMFASNFWWTRCNVIELEILFPQTQSIWLCWWLISVDYGNLVLVVFVQ